MDGSKSVQPRDTAEKSETSALGKPIAHSVPGPFLPWLRPAGSSPRNRAVDSDLGREMERPSKKWFKVEASGVSLSAFDPFWPPTP